MQPLSVRNACVALGRAVSGTGPSSCRMGLNQCPLGDTGHTLSCCTGQGTPSLHRAHLSIHIAETNTVTFSRCPSSHRETSGKTKGSGSSCSPQLSAGRPAAFPCGACHNSLSCAALLPGDEDRWAASSSPRLGGHPCPACPSSAHGPSPGDRCVRCLLIEKFLIHLVMDL